MVQQVVSVIRKLQEERIAVLLVEQNALTALAVANRVYVMDKGKVVHQGPAPELLKDASLRTRLLGV
jgi:branched-chain amino acid transport system ATP-binding protein